jgi:hypothetical protein
MSVHDEADSTSKFYSLEIIFIEKVSHFLSISRAIIESSFKNEEKTRIEEAGEITATTIRYFYYQFASEKWELSRQRRYCVG